MAIVRRDRSLTTPLEISSRSDNVSASLDRRRGGGRIPPLGTSCLNIEDEYRSKMRPIEHIACPLDFRIGISLGDVVDDGEDIHGEGVNVAARIEALAETGGHLCFRCRT